MYLLDYIDDVSFGFKSNVNCPWWSLSPIETSFCFSERHSI